MVYMAQHWWLYEDGWRRVVGLRDGSAAESPLEYLDGGDAGTKLSNDQMPKLPKYQVNL